MHFMEALTPYFHILLEFLLGTQIKPVSPSTVVCCTQIPSLPISRAQELLDSLMSKDDAIRDEVSKCELAANDGKFRYVAMCDQLFQNVTRCCHV